MYKSVICESERASGYSTTLPREPAKPLSPTVVGPSQVDGQGPGREAIWRSPKSWPSTKNETSRVHVSISDVDDMEFDPEPLAPPVAPE